MAEVLEGHWQEGGALRQYQMISFGFDVFLPDGPLGNGNLLPFILHDLRMFSGRERFAEFMPYDHRGGGAFALLSQAKEAIAVPISQIGSTKYLYSLPITGYIEEYFGYDKRKTLGLRSMFDGVSAVAKRHIQEGQATLVVDFMFEGFCNNYFEIFDHIHNQCEAANIPLSRVAFMTGNLATERNYKDWCDRVQPKERIRVLMLDWFRHALASEMRLLPVKFVTRFEALNSLIRYKMFLNFNRVPRFHRTIFVSQIARHKLEHAFHLSFPKEIPHTIDLSRIIKNHTNLPELLPDIRRLEQKIPYVVDTADFHINHASTHNKKPYLDSFISVVSETQFYEAKGDSVFFSEKIYKAIANMHPFILIGSAKSLQTLRDMGFKTFAPYIDESYDDEYDPYLRMEMVVKEIIRIVCTMPINVTRSWYENIMPNLEHNRNLLLNTPNDITDQIKNFLNPLLK